MSARSGPASGFPLSPRSLTVIVAASLRAIAANAHVAPPTRAAARGVHEEPAAVAGPAFLEPSEVWRRQNLGDRFGGRPEEPAQSRRALVPRAREGAVRPSRHA